MLSRIFILTFCLILSLFHLTGCGGKSGNTTIIVKPEAELKETWNILILPFEISGKSKLTGEDAMNLLMSDLIDMEGYKVIERESLGGALDQIGFSLSDLSNSSNTLRVGQFLGARLFCIGSINKRINLITARITLTETREQLFIVQSRNKNELEGIREISNQIKEKLYSSDLITSLNKHSEVSEKPASPPPKSVEVKGYGPIVDDDIATARELALKDAYSKAIEQISGVKLMRRTQVQNYQLVQDKILTESVGYVASYEILDENKEGEFGYEISVNASVSQEPLKELDKLPLMVKYLLADPRIVVTIEGDLLGKPMEQSRSSLIAGQISGQLQKAGFSVIDPKAVEDKKKDFADSLSKEDAARLGSILNANVTVRGSISTSITSKIEEIDGKKLDTPPIAAATTGSFQIVLTDTAEVVSTINHEILSRQEKVGYGSRDDAAVGRSLDAFTQAIGGKLAWELASSLGGPATIRLTIRDLTLEEAEKIRKQLQAMPEHIVLEVKMLNFKNNVVDYQIKTAVKSMVLQKKLMNSLDAEALKAKEFFMESVDFGAIVISLKR
ncbi:hypothetical protein GF312_15720 [Candidatus Poribacteria bacterium]|nr:hypothetical protein [Candidatus Poribacteria bacterium]